jgi:hypothetical protein|tara:strand:- start:1500 stop:1646 length:147 start_codon:yes stop_codon:yes gene_type:complete
MSEATFNFRLQTLLDEIEMHPHREEIVSLLAEQVSDDTAESVKFTPLV